VVQYRVLIGNVPWYQSNNHLHLHLHKVYILRPDGQRVMTPTEIAPGTEKHWITHAARNHTLSGSLFKLRRWFGRLHASWSILPMIHSESGYMYNPRTKPQLNRSVVSRLSEHPARRQGGHRERSGQSLRKGHCFINKPLAREMGQCKRICEEGNSIDPRIGDVVCGVGAHDGCQEGPCAEKTGAESGGFSC
jgi:hypothetical protein